MRIVRIETFRAERYPNLLELRLHTDDGLYGLGETYFGAEAVEGWVHETAAPYLLGKDPRDRERHWRGLTPFVGLRSTGVENRGRSAVDIALWDLFGKMTGMPLYQLLGGRTRDRVRVYNTCAGYLYVRGLPSHAHLPTDNWGVTAPGNDRPYEDLHAFLHHADELAQSLVAEGYTGMKIWPFDPYAERTDGHGIDAADLRRGLEPFERIRKAVGDRIEVMVELHSLWDLPTAVRIARALAPYDPTWIEDPIRMDNLDALKTFRDRSGLPTTASETLGTRWAFRDLLDKDAVDYVMFDPCWVGGVSEGVKVASLAATFQRPIAPHDCTGPVEFAASVHLSTSVPNVFVQEVVRAFFSGWYKDVVSDIPAVEGGFVRPLEGPGLGTDLLPQFLAAPDVHVRCTSLD